MGAEITSRVGHATAYLTSIIGESVDDLGKGEYMGMIRAQEKETTKKVKEEAEKAAKEAAEKASAEKTAAENRSFFSRMVG